MNEKRQMKILQVITKSNFGGAQKYVYELSEELKKNGFEIAVALGGSGILKEKLEKSEIRTISVKSLTRDINIFSEIKVFFELIKIFRKEKPDVIHLNSSKIGGIGGVAGRICFVPRIIFTFHGLAFNENRNFFSKFFIKFLYLITIALSHKTIAVSDNLREQIFKIPLARLMKNKIVTIRNAIKPVNFLGRDESRAFIENKIGLSVENQQIIGTIAELHHIKGLNYLVESAKKISEKNLEMFNRLIFVVFGEGEERKNLEKQIKDTGLEKKFFLLGFVDGAPKYLKGLDLFVLPSLSEGLALAILEAKQANLPIVASRVGGIPEAVNGYSQAILFESKNSDDLAGKIENILTENTSQNMAENKDILEDFDKMFQKTVNNYR